MFWTIALAVTFGPMLIILGICAAVGLFLLSIYTVFGSLYIITKIFSKIFSSEIFKVIVVVAAIFIFIFLIIVFALFS